MISPWAIVVGIVVVIMVILAIRGWIIARRCRGVLMKGIKKGDVIEPNVTEDSESGGASSG